MASGVTTTTLPSPYTFIDALAAFWFLLVVVAVIALILALITQSDD